ncbi:MAG: LLM class flavin-dependent oxidoreductase [Candidatus Pelagadaptatus aseana]|uniref:LLM class flavin-dependent oxidoreductase n=1 Tax=Candidatus Pelagadaptatus aseana TaxID=3120508 RepID=UPI0039B13631
MIRYSILDLCPVADNQTPREALANALSLAQFAENRGFNRYWLAEHHNMEGIASAATSVVIGHIAAGTERIRVGAGGIMLPNHAPLQIAEQFGTLETLYPGRIDLGLGRAPGTDGATAYALRRNLHGDDNRFPRDVQELMHYFDPLEPGQKVIAVPGAGLDIPVWILGSSLFGAQLAAALGLPYAFASHFAPAQLHEAIELYRRQFQPSDKLREPYVMAGFNVIAADTDDEATYLATSLQQSFLKLRQGNPGKLPAPREGFMGTLAPQERALLNQVLACSAIGSKTTVENKIWDFIDHTGVDELMVTGSIHDHQARLKSFDILSQVMGNP